MQFNQSCHLIRETVYETPYSLLDNLSPAYREAFGNDLTTQLLKLQKQREEEQSEWIKQYFNDIISELNGMGPPPYGRSQTVPYHKPLSVMERKQSQEQQMLANQRQNAPFVPEFSDFNNTFEVEIKRNSLGLGFSIDGGPDAAAPWTNLVRVKKIFPLQPAWETGKLRVSWLKEVDCFFTPPHIQFDFIFRSGIFCCVSQDFHSPDLVSVKHWIFSDHLQH